MWSVMVVVVAPLGQFNTDLMQRREQGLIELLISQLAIETLNVAILHGLAWSDIVPLDLGLISPAQDRIAGQLRAIVTDHHLGLAALHHQPGQFSGYPQP